MRFARDWILTSAISSPRSFSKKAIWSLEPSGIVPGGVLFQIFLIKSSIAFGNTCSNRLFCDKLKYEKTRGFEEKSYRFIEVWDDTQA